MVVYAVAADASIIRVFLAGIIPGVLLMALFSGYIVVWALLNPERTPSDIERVPFIEKIRRSRELIPCALLIVFILYVLLAGLATATECAAYGVLGSLVIAWWGGSLTRAKFAESLVGATRVSCMIMFILAGASFLSKAMAFTGIPRELAEWVSSLGLNRYALIAILAVFYVILGAALDGISMIVSDRRRRVADDSDGWLRSGVVWRVHCVAGRDCGGHSPGRFQSLCAAEHDRQGQQHDRARGATVFRDADRGDRIDHDLPRDRHLAARSGNGRAAVMHVVVIGAGIIGVTTAYFLRRDGHDVTVIERRSGVAQETSFANAGVMAPSYVAPWSQPGMPAKVLAYLFKAEAPIVFRPSLDPALWSWIARWLGECRLERFTRNKARMQRLAFYSQSELRALRELHQLRLRADHRIPAALSYATWKSNDRR